MIERWWNRSACSACTYESVKQSLNSQKTKYSSEEEDKEGKKNLVLKHKYLHYAHCIFKYRCCLAIKYACTVKI